MNRPMRYLMLTCGLISLYIAVTNIAEGSLSDVLSPGVVAVLLLGGGLVLGRGGGFGPWRPRQVRETVVPAEGPGEELAAEPAGTAATVASSAPASEGIGATAIPRRALSWFAIVLLVSCGGASWWRP